jgi:hypothetical protein
MRSLLFSVGINNSWANLVRTELLSVSASIICCERKNLRDVNFCPLEEGIWLNNKNGLNLKDAPI